MIIIIVQAFLFVGGLVWCYQMYDRWRDDLDTLRTSEDNTSKAVVAGLWLLTFVIAILVVTFAWNVIAAIVKGILGLM